jgi:hypothetical protein
MHTHHMQNRHEGVQGLSDDLDEVVIAGRVVDKHTKGVMTKGLRLTSGKSLECTQVLMEVPRAYVGIPG